MGLNPHIKLRELKTAKHALIAIFRKQAYAFAGARKSNIILAGPGVGNMILVGLGSNLVTVEFDTSQKLLEAAINSMKNHGINVVSRSSWYSSAPIPASDQPWFTNGVVQVESRLEPAALLQALHSVEHEYGRMRGQRNDSRTLDLDLLAYDDRLFDEPEGLKLPHPRLPERAFVLIPLAEIAPGWRHPESGLTAAEMLELLPSGQRVARLS